MLELFEYLFDPITAFRNVYNFLKPGGIFYLSVPFVYPHHNPSGKDYLRVTRWGVEKLLKETGFEIKEIVPRIERITSCKISLPEWFDKEGMHVSKEYDGHNEIGYLVKAIKL